MKPIVPMHLHIRKMVQCQAYLSITAMWPEHHWEARRDWFECKACGAIMVYAVLYESNHENMQMNGWRLAGGHFWCPDEFKQSCAETITNDVHET